VQSAAGRSVLLSASAPGLPAEPAGQKRMSPRRSR
jgi:hypothetical protein